MKNILIIVDGILGKKYLQQITENYSVKHKYYVVYYKKSTLNKKTKNITYYNFDPTSFRKLSPILRKYDFHLVMITLSNRIDSVATIDNIRKVKLEQIIVLMDRWDIKTDDKYLHKINSNYHLVQRLYQMLPDVPLVAQNIGLGKGEIMEIRVPFGSSYLYRHTHSIERGNWRVAAIYRNDKLLLPSYNLTILPNDRLIIIGNPSVLRGVARSIKKEFGQFPQPFGQNIYCIIDSYKKSEKEIDVIINDSMLFQTNLNSQKLIIKVLNPTYSNTINKIKKIKQEHLLLHQDFFNKPIEEMLNEELEEFNIGLVITDKNFFNKHKRFFYKQNKAILKVGNHGCTLLEQSLILNSDSSLIEKISSAVFDISNQLGFHIAVSNYQLDEAREKKDNIREHFNSLSEIFGNKVTFTNTNTNPLRKMRKQNNFLHCIPFSKKILKSNIIAIFSNDIDKLYFKLKNSYQLFLPVD